jgi:hypothetical protein
MTLAPALRTGRGTCNEGAIGGLTVRCLGNDRPSEWLGVLHLWPGWCRWPSWYLRRSEARTGVRPHTGRRHEHGDGVVLAGRYLDTATRAAWPEGSGTATPAGHGPTQGR